jgi:hypothetical protein
MTAAFRVDVMSSPSQNGRPMPSESPDSAGVVSTSKRHVTDADVADGLIRAVRACAPGDPQRVAALCWAVDDYVDAARARGETHERTVSAVRHMITTLVLSPEWCGLHRAEARDIIRSVVAAASARYYVESAYREAQPSTAFHFEVSGRVAPPAPPALRGSDDDE